MLVEALRTGFIEGDGPYFPQPRTEIRPRPERSFDDRLYAVASSDDSVEAAARFAGRMTMFADRSWDHRLPSIEPLPRAASVELHGRTAPPLMTADFCLCMARRRARRPRRPTATWAPTSAACSSTTR